MGRRILYKPFEEINDKYIIQKFWPKILTTFKNQFNHGHVSEDELKYLNERFNDSKSIEETLFRIKYKIYEKPKCPICGKSIEFTYYFKEYCSPACANKNPERCELAKESLHKKYDKTTEEGQKNIEDLKTKMSETSFKNYGCTWPNQNKKLREKIKQTNLEKYGVESVFLLKEVQEKARQKSHTPEVKQKAKETIFKKYGVYSVLDIPEVKEKAQKKILIHQKLDKKQKKQLINDME